MFSRSFSRFGKSVAARPVRGQTRKLGAAPAAKGTPYEPHHEPSIYGNTPHPFGIGPNYKMEGWEIPVVGTLIICGAMLVYSEAFQENETPMQWARREAIARNKVIENGGEVKFGKYYMYTNFSDKKDKFKGVHEVVREDFKYIVDEEEDEVE